MKKLLTVEQTRSRQWRDQFLEDMEECKGILSAVCKKNNYSYSQLQRIIKSDPDLQYYVNECRRECSEYKKDIAEEALIDLVEQRHPQAVIHMNKTLNRDRGYGESVDVNGNVGGSISVSWGEN